MEFEQKEAEDNDRDKEEEGGRDERNEGGEDEEEIEGDVGEGRGELSVEIVHIVRESDLSGKKRKADEDEKDEENGEKRTMMRPMGVVSKKAIGAFRREERRRLWKD